MKGNEIMNGLPSGTVLHGKSYDYEIVKPLGQGTFGITYLAKVILQGELGAINATVHVAIKEFFMHEINGRENTSVTSGTKEGLYDKYKRKFIGEARNLSKLKHDNIIKVIEAFEANNTVYYSMEYIDGGNLDEYILSKGSLTLTQTLELTKQISIALSCMHSQNMLHLDLKPSNVMLRKGVPILIDFGLSKQFDDFGDPESSTTIGAGTPGYAPIEQSNYHGDTKNGLPVTMDIYALGATMFKMLTGHKPPISSDILNDGFPADELTVKGISNGVVQLIEWAMAPMRKNRIQSADQFTKELSKIMGNEDEATVYHTEETKKPEERKATDEEKTVIVSKKEQASARPEPPKTKDNNKRKWIRLLAVAAIIGAIIKCSGNKEPKIVDDPVIDEPYENITEQVVHSQSDTTALSENENVKSVYDPKLGINMIRVKHGTFMMGANPDDLYAFPNNMPAHKVTLTKDYLIGETEVTQKLWKQVMGTNPSYFKGDDLPVANVTYREVLAFIDKLNESYVADKSRPYRLPTEAEWEYAARGGHKMTNTVYAGSNDITDVASNESLTTFSANPPKRYKPNELGIYDMSGNVAELTSDWYASYREGHQIDPKVSKENKEGAGHVYRGGVNAANEYECTVYYRNDFFSSRRVYIGFRLCRDY